MTLEQEYGPVPAPLYWAEEGRVIRVCGTRIPLERIVYFHSEGNTPEAIVESVPTLELPAVYETIAYYLRNREKVDWYVERCRIEAKEIRRLIEARQGPEEEFWKRLKMRQAASQKGDAPLPGGRRLQRRSRCRSANSPSKH